ncbi:MAG: UDP-glucose--hexose-1-phosphate uridylyltransferase [Clostridia bacterium]|nr:UDP-glucose--hexose-1-phosphate uridylyltransferase [Clostridia bacterium]
MICTAIQKLLEYALAKELITEDDLFVARNLLMDTLKVDNWEEPQEGYQGEPVDALLETLMAYAVEQGILTDTANNRDLFDTRLMGLLTPMPREIIKTFREHYARDPREATDWYFKNSCDLNYVRAGRIAKDRKWTYDSEYGTLDITINCSKPEKDPRDIAAAGKAKAVAYPKCQLCAENAGFAGHATHPARQNLRPIPLKVNGGDWLLQYSPYGYYNEHCIVFNAAHIPMAIDNAVFDKLFDILDFLPHYFVGSNADLPIVGGSILSHEHFQGGHYTFAMTKAKEEHSFTLEDFPTVTACTLKWPMSVIRLRSADRKALVACCQRVLQTWRGYSDEAVDILAFTGDTPHNTVTPIARMRDGAYECDLVLRNNRTTEERPMGLFHPNPSLHHIKKENIGLIEVMGLAVLPSRLVGELDELEQTMLAGGAFDTPSLKSHEMWAKGVLEAHPEFNKDNARAILECEVGRVFAEVLEDAGVFKRDAVGVQAFTRFIESL